MKTYNEIVAVIEALADSHMQLASFYEGDPWDIGASGKVEYPSLWMWTTGQISQISIEQKKLDLRIQLSCFDMVQAGKINEREVKSDTLLILLDIISLLQEDDADIIVEPDIQLTPMTDSFDDQITGWMADITLRLDYLTQTCNLPTT